MAAGAKYSGYRKFATVFPEYVSAVPAIDKRLKQFEEFTIKEHDTAPSIRLESLPMVRKLNESGFVTTDSQDGYVGERDLRIESEKVMGSNNKPIQFTSHVERAYVEGMLPTKLYEKMRANWPKGSSYQLYNYKSGPKKHIPLTTYTVTLSSGKKEKETMTHLWLPEDPESYVNLFKFLAEEILGVITPEEWSFVIAIDKRWKKDAFAKDGLFTFIAKLLDKSLTDLKKKTAKTHKRRRVTRRNVSRRR